jgi:hypothetical protein
MRKPFVGMDLEGNFGEKAGTWCISFKPSRKLKNATGNQEEKKE